MNSFAETEHLKNYKAWFVKVLESLYPDRDAGFVIMMGCLPLLERYLRNKIGLATDKSVSQQFFNEILNIFPELKSYDNSVKFWFAFRNGVLHQVTTSGLEKKTNKVHSGIVTHDINAPIEIKSSDIYVHPVELCKRILQKIQDDFSIYEGVENTYTVLPSIRPIMANYKSNTSSEAWGTTGHFTGTPLTGASLFGSRFSTDNEK